MNCKWEIQFDITIPGIAQGEMGHDKGVPVFGLFGVHYNITAAGNKNVFRAGVTSNGEMKFIFETQIMNAVVCLSENEVQTLQMRISASGVGKGRATGVHKVKVIGSRNIGPCDK